VCDPDGGREGGRAGDSSSWGATTQLSPEPAEGVTRFWPPEKGTVLSRSLEFMSKHRSKALGRNAEKLPSYLEALVQIQKP
jgi:hypothetical protein